MTEVKQPEALRLAGQLRALSFGGTCILAADELRRQRRDRRAPIPDFDEPEPRH